MQTFFLKQSIFVSITVIAMTLCSCKEEPTSENAVQQSIDLLLTELQIATMGSNAQGLEQVIASANKIRPTAQAQIQSKNILLSTAKEKLAQLQFQILSAKTTAIIPIFSLAENQAIQVALLRDAADSLSISAQNELLLSEEITSAQDPKRNHYNDQLSDALAELEALDSQRQVSKEDAQALRQQADQLLNEAEDAGLIKGHSAYKSGVKTMRQSQQADLSAAEIELLYQMQAKPLRDDAKAELEAIASILNGMEHTESLLEHLQSTTTQSAADFRELADDIDTQAAGTMNEAITQASGLIEEWNALTSLIQDAMRGSGRAQGKSRETQQTAGIWKLDLEWTLGQVEEAKRTFLLEEARSLHAFVEYGIVTSSSKWRDLSNSIRAEVEQATISAMAAYENAKQLAGNIGQQGVTLIQQLDRRMAILNGDAIPTPAPVSETTEGTIPSSSSGGGFDTPQALITAFNVATDIDAFDGTAPVVNIDQFYKFEDDQAIQLVAFMNKAIQSTGNMLIAIRDNMGEDAVTEFRSKNPSQAKSFVMTIDPSSIVQPNDEEATATEVSGKQVRLQLTPSGWKIVLSMGNDSEASMAFTMMSQTLAPIFDSISLITKQIKDGQITTIDQLEEAMISQMENMNPL